MFVEECGVLAADKHSKAQGVVSAHQISKGANGILYGRQRFAIYGKGNRGNNCQEEGQGRW